MVKAYHIIHNIKSKSKVSIAKNLNIVKTYHKFSLIENILVKYLDHFYNYALLDAFTYWKNKILFYFTTSIWRNRRRIHFLKNTLDFIGVNHYNQIYLDFNFLEKDKINIKLNNPDNNLFVNQMNWDILPEGMYLILKRIKKYNLPILITENGNLFRR